MRMWKIQRKLLLGWAFKGLPAPGVENKNFKGTITDGIHSDTKSIDWFTIALCYYSNKYYKLENDLNR